MKYVLALLTAVIVTACVTSGDLQRITDSVANLEVTAQDQTATTADISAAVENVKETVKAVAENAENRTGDIIGEFAEDPISALIKLLITGGAAAYGVNRYRNAKRVARGEPV